MDLERSRSESELLSASQKTPENIYVTTTHNKRRRVDEFELFRQDITKMMTDMLSQQMIEIRKNTDMLNDIKQTNRNIEDSMSFLSEQYEEYKKKIEQLEISASEDRKYIALLENKVLDMQREFRKTNLEIKNVPEQKSETKDNLVSMASNLGNVIDCPIKTSDIKDIYRVKNNKKDNSKTSTVIIETTSTLLRNEVLKKCKVFNMKKQENLCAKHLGLQENLHTPVFVSEQLTPQAARLHFLARKLKQDKLFKHCWTSYGRVYLRKGDNTQVIPVTSEAQIQRLYNQSICNQDLQQTTHSNNDLQQQQSGKSVFVK